MVSQFLRRTAAVGVDSGEIRFALAPACGNEEDRGGGAGSLEQLGSRTTGQQRSKWTRTRGQVRRGLGVRARGVRLGGGDEQGRGTRCQRLEARGGLAAAYRFGRSGLGKGSWLGRGAALRCVLLPLCFYF